MVNKATPSLEERVSHLEGWKESEEILISGIRVDINDLKTRITNMDEHINGRINALDQKVDRRIDALDQKVDRFRDELSGRIATLEKKVDNHFKWIIGIQVTTIFAILGILLKML